MHDVIIIGGGIVGMSTAYELVKRGAKVLLFDRLDKGRATDAGAGILSAETYSGDSEPWFRLGLLASDYYPGLIESLQTDQAEATGYARCGKLSVAVSDDEIEPFEEAKKRIFKRQKESGRPSSNDLFEISPNDARDLFPPLATVRDAIYYRNAARVDGRLLNKALRLAAEIRGLTIIRESIDRLNINARRFTSAVTHNDHYAAKNLVIAGGAWSRKFGEQLGVQIPIDPQRGQIIHLDLPHSETDKWAIINAFREHYIVPWPDNRIVVGATRESGSGFEPHTTVAGIIETLGEALRVAPGLEGAAIREIRVGLRPLSVDSLPVLGPIPAIDNVYVATGHGASGLLLGPYSGKIIADSLLGLELECDLSAFHVNRFKN